MIIDFKNKVVLVTASSKGIGFELVKQFLINNAKVCMCSRNNNNLKLAKKKLSQFKQFKNLFVLRHDISNIKSNKYLIKKIKKRFNKNVDILINNSGGPNAKLVESININEWYNALENNLMSAISLSKEALLEMKKNRWGRIINLTSTLAKEPAENMGLSNVTRAALAAYSKTLSIENARFNITVNTILTGGCLTDRLYKLIEGSTKNKNSFRKKLKLIVETTPMKRIANPNEFVQLILFLASDNSSYVNGTSIAIDGGVSKNIF